MSLVSQGLWTEAASQQKLPVIRHWERTKAKLTVTHKSSCLKVMHITPALISPKQATAQHKNSGKLGSTVLPFAQK